MATKLIINKLIKQKIVNQKGIIYHKSTSNKDALVAMCGQTD
jgi:hypothetical protein